MVECTIKTWVAQVRTGMNQLIRYYANMVMLKARPQDCPVSNGLQFSLMLGYLMLAVISALSIYNLWGSVVTSLLDLGILYMFTLVLLSSKKERIHQTFNAFLGAGIIIGIFSAVCSYLFEVDPETKTISDAGIIVFLLIFVWIVIVFGHIIRHAVDTSLSIGIALGLGYVIINTIVIITFSDLLRIS